MHRSFVFAVFVLAGNFDAESTKKFYDSAPKSYLDTLAVSKGLDKFRDLHILLPYLTERFGEKKLRDDTFSSFEIGAGSGRVLDWLVKSLPGTQVTGFEISPVNSAQLREKFGKQSNIKIVEANFVTTDLKDLKTDLVLWMWSGFLEINKDEKRISLEKISGALSAKGLLVIDLPETINGRRINDLNLKNEEIEINEGFGLYRAHIIKPKDLIEMASQSKLRIFRQYTYKTDTGLLRSQYLFEQAPFKK